MALPPLRVSEVSGRYGAPMGRRDWVPLIPDTPVKLRMARMPLVDGCYDMGGAYWGGPSDLFHIESLDEHLIAGGLGADDFRGKVVMFRRAKSRAEAKKLIRETLPNARFYR